MREYVTTETKRVMPSAGAKLMKAMITVANDMPAATVVDRYSPVDIDLLRGKKSRIFRIFLRSR